MSFLVWVHASQDFAQTQKNFARSHDRVTVTFRNSAGATRVALGHVKGQDILLSEILSMAISQISYHFK